MSTSLMVRVSRDGKEIGEYSVPDALRMLSGCSWKAPFVVRTIIGSRG